MRTVLLITACMTITTVAHGATYYVAKTGSDSHSCTQAQSAATPRLTIGAGLACLASGDTLIIQAGTYAENINNTIPSGTASARTVVQAASANTVILQPTTGTGSGGDAITISNRSYITLDGLVVDANQVPNHAIRLSGTTTHVIIRNGTIMGGGRGSSADSGNGIFVQDEGTTDNQFINLDIRDNGTPGSSLEHGVYIRSARNVVERCRIYNNAGYGVHVYFSTNRAHSNVIRYNEVYGNGSRGILIGSGNNNVAHHNIVRGNNSIGMEIGFSSPQNNQMYYNTVYANAAQCIRVRSDAQNAVVQNNICWNNTVNSILNEGSGTTLGANLFVNPLFVDAAQADFHP